jgi:hypothetical protein
MVERHYKSNIKSSIRLRFTLSPTALNRIPRNVLYLINVDAIIILSNSRQFQILSGAICAETPEERESDDRISAIRALRTHNATLAPRIKIDSLNMISPCGGRQETSNNDLYRRIRKGRPPKSRDYYLYRKSPRA